MNKTELNHAIQDDIETLRWMNVQTLGARQYAGMHRRWAMLLFLFLWGSFFGVSLIRDILFKWHDVVSDPVTFLMANVLCNTLAPFIGTILLYRTLGDLVWFKQELKQKLKTGSMYLSKIRNVCLYVYGICLISMFLPLHGSEMVFYILKILEVIICTLLIKSSFDRELGIFRSTGFIKAVDKYLKRQKHAAKRLVPESI